MELRLHQITCAYGAQTALDRVSLHVRSGDCYGFLGHNGAGKTTAMRVALGLLRPRSGTVLVDGFDAALHPREARARTGGLIETPGFHDGLSGDRNLRMLARLQGLGRAAAAQESKRVLAAVGLGTVGGKPVGAFSQGMRQRLGIAQALLGRPPIVLLDEPTNGLDPEGIEEIRHLFRSLVAEDGVTLLVSSHQLHELAGLCNRVGILRHGRLLLEEETSSLLAAGRVRLVAGDPAAARRVIDSRGLACDVHGDEFLIEAVGAAADALLSELVAGGALPRSFAPHTDSLEDVYLRVAHDDGARGAELAAPAATTKALARRAPGGPARRVLAYEMRRFLSSAAVPIALLAPAVVGVAAAAFRAANARGFAAEVAAGELASTTDVTAFEGVAVALRAGLPVLALVVAAIGSQQISAERSHGTLRNLLLRPLARRDAAAGKALGLLVASLAGYAALCAGAFAAATLLFDFKDVSEIFNGEPFPLVPAAELWPPLRTALWAQLPGVLACAGIGLAAGSLVKRSAAALGVTFGVLGLLDAGRAVLAGFGIEHLSPLQYVPTWLRDRSFVRHFLDLSQGVSNTAFDQGTSQVVVPLIWVVVAFGVTLLALSRRSVR